MPQHHQQDHLTHIPTIPPTPWTSYFCLHHISATTPSTHHNPHNHEANNTTVSMTFVAISSTKHIQAILCFLKTYVMFG